MTQRIKVYTIIMKITFDTAKNEKNIRERSISFEQMAEIDWETVILEEDIRKEYGEIRIQVTGFINDRLHVSIITYRRGCLHVISMRKANLRERKKYEKEKSESLHD